MNFIELFAGIGGFRLGLERQGHKCVWSNEWLAKPRGIYEYNFKEIPDGRDIRTVPANDVPDADLIVGGFPCATFSIAGKRTGFGYEDTRGTLCFEMFRIAHERHIHYILFENVKGLLNHDNGRTFEVIKCSLDELGYDGQWEVLDSQNFGVPQHRERLFFIGSLRGKPRPKVFPISEPSREDGNQNGEPREEGESVTQWRRGHFRDYKASGVPTLTANMGLGGHNVPFLKQDGYIGRNSQGQRYYSIDGVAPTLRGVGGGIGGKSALINTKVYEGGQAKVNDYDSVCQCLTALGGKGGGGTSNIPCVSVKPVLTPMRENKRQNGRRFKEDGEPAFTIGVQDRHGVQVGNSIRKLTPLECERLQGLPDNWTKYRIDNGKVVENADSERYERCGRAVTIPVIEAIGKKLGREWYER